ncbi:50S ribosomal protein L25/general stress protein Ctc [Deinococcus metallilatus]|uniref:Large ribosomal subunit protein bL25 n=1 Tax=Deinococcus metallilatus TaxID=1211322 RepID=A0AAJ5F2W0_9DEIO|nr:50S ribosomal protein L25/general stress protein Ctc [Deinococcus metallilatus]MBB5295391.1 large subunit ribosomal protein L25 [Deinococcus metallilatus]QBY08079.1 50S ribosomal protein L25/general stress protein Ctc [Deinococcus metallilatus]RXJ12972.1 50S ribosomal protein L25/general stress protein Ctc [Deinococcus metallilatus]TLK27106.1 50S ribosomal protein L25/general stress protein Ctc [Deinococcus metallilatus]GMA16068.1 50S ribosomal protein L25 [Deinococcus metallilatus]
MELRATPRKSQEKLAEGMIPAVAYNKEKNVNFAIERKAFDRAFRQQGTTGLFDITIEGGETFPALVKAVQMDKRRREAIHADFYMVTYGEPIEVSVPVHTSGKAQGEVQGGLVDIVVHNLNVIAPGPRRIPQEIAVDVTRLNIGDHVTAGQIRLPEGVKLAVDADLVVLSVLPPRLSAEELEAQAQAAQVAGMVASGEISEAAAEAVLEGAASIEEVKASEGSEAQRETEAASEEANQG